MVILGLISLSLMGGCNNAASPATEGTKNTSSSVVQNEVSNETNSDMNANTDFSSNKQESNSPANSNGNNENNNMVLKSENISVDNKDGFSADITYPVITGMSNADEQNKINELLVNKAENFEAAGQQTLSSLNEVDEKQGLTQEESVTASMDYKLEWLTNDLISLSFDEYTNFGGPKPNVFKDGFTYDLKNNKEISLSNLVNDAQPIISLSQDVKKSLRKTRILKQR